MPEQNPALKEKMMLTVYTACLPPMGFNQLTGFMFFSCCKFTKKYE
jgi:hypothetical protein